MKNWACRTRPRTPISCGWIRKKDAKAVNQALLRKGVIIRVSDSFRAPTHLRVTIGTPEENKRFLDALRDVLPTI